MNEKIIEPGLEQFLKGKGYTVIRTLGEGHTRDVYEVEYQQGSLQKRRVLKVPKTEIDENSVTTLINMSKGDLDEREVLALNKVSHPHIIEIFDAFKIGEKTVTVEEHYDAMSLEDMLKWSGPLENPERFKHIFKQVASGLQHLHVNERIIHRDIKPSNILIGKDTVKLSDLQTAGKLDGITESFLPTRGGTKFTSPHILNALFSGRQTAANIQSEFYALGATMYYALTRKSLFDTELVADEHGRAINIDGKVVKAELKQNGQQIHSIDIDKHDVLVRERLKQIPRQYRKLLLNCLSVKNPKYTDNHAHDYFAEDFENATKKELLPWKSIKKHAIGFTAIVGIISGIFAGIKTIALQDRISGFKEPEIHQTLAKGIFADSGLDNLLKQESSLEMLTPYFKEIKENEKIMFKEGGMGNSVEIACGIHDMSRRLGYSLVRSALLENETAKKTEYGNIRFSSTLVPKAFIERLYCADFNGKPRHSLEEFEKGDERNREHICKAYAVRYLKHQLGNNNSLADLYAAYFCDQDDLFEARKKSNSKQYFPTTKDGQKIPGYSESLPQIKRNLINRAMALYYITDNEGRIHYDLLDSNNRPTKGLTDK